MNIMCEHCQVVVAYEDSYSISMGSREPRFNLCFDCAAELQNTQKDTLGIPPTIQNNALLRIAQEVTDEVFGQGMYAQVNGAPPLTIQEEPDGHDL